MLRRALCVFVLLACIGVGVWLGLSARSKGDIDKLLAVATSGLVGALGCWFIQDTWPRREP